MSRPTRHNAATNKELGTFALGARMVRGETLKQPASLWFGCVLAVIATVPVTTRTLAQESPSLNPPQPTGRIDFDFADAPPATVELDLAPELIGLGESLAASVIDAVTEVLQQDPKMSQQLELTDERLAAIRHVVSQAQGLVEEVHVRVYEDAESMAVPLARHYHAKIQNQGWDNVATVRDGDDYVQVAVFRQTDAIRGVFIIVSDSGDDVVLVNVACDVSPEKVKSLVSTSLRIGMELGLGDVFRDALHKVSKELPRR